MTLSDFPNEMPAITLDFLNSRQLDPRITFTRASTGTGTVDGEVHTFPTNVSRLTEQGLLVEESRTNAITYSTAPDAEFTQDSANFTYTFNQPAPDGTNTAHLIENSSNTSSNRGGYFSAYATIPTSGKIALSVFVKPVGGQVIWLSGDPGNQGFYGVGLTYFDFTVSPPTANKNAANGTPSAYNLVVDPFIEDVGNGWYRLINIVDLDSTTFSKTGQTRSPRVCPVTTGTSCYVWGYQIETGAGASSYIPTSGATVTRAADTCEITGTNFSSWYNSGAGTICATFRSQFPDGEETTILQSTGANTFRIFDFTNYNRVQFLYGSTNIYSNNATSGYPAESDFSSAAMFYTDDGTASSVGGSFQGFPVVSTTGTGGVTVSGLRFAPFTGASGALQASSAHLSRISYYPTRLPDDALEALTT